MQAALIVLTLVFGYVIFSYLEYAGHRWLLHKMRMANRLNSQWLRTICINHMKLHHGSDFEHEHKQRDDDPVQLAITGIVVMALPTAVLHYFLPECAYALMGFGVVYALLAHVVHQEFHRQTGAFYSNTAYFRYLKHCHRLHHEQPGTNFNVILPLFDWVFGTQAKQSALSPAYATADAK